MSDYVFRIPHSIVENRHDSEKKYAIKLHENPYDGIIITYGKVTFGEDEENDILRIAFEYTIEENNENEYDMDVFEKYIGDLLQELIIFQLSNNNLVFSGGTDENRKNDSE